MTRDFTSGLAAGFFPFAGRVFTAVDAKRVPAAIVRGKRRAASILERTSKKEASSAWIGI